MALRYTLFAAAVVAASSAQAATVFLDESAYLSALGSKPVLSQGFTGLPNAQLTSPTVFSSGLEVNPNGPSGDNRVESDTLRLSIDNPNGGENLTTSVDVILPQPSFAFSFLFGTATTGSRPSGLGVGNDSGTTLTAGSFSFDFADNTSVDSAFDGTDPGYTGFFGVIGASGEVFQNLRFATNATGDRNDDDFTVRSLTFSPVPVPAGLPLLATGLVAFGLMRRLKKA